MKKFFASFMILGLFVLPVVAFADPQEVIKVEVAPDGTRTTSVTNLGTGRTTSVTETGANTQIKGTIPNPIAKTGVNSLMGLINILLKNIVMPIASVGVVVWIIWAGFSYVMANGNPKKIEEAHQRLLWALVGAGVLLGATAISQVVETTIKQLL